MDRFRLMNLFVRIVETGSFSAVARELEMLQPSVSKHMNMLEQGLGVRLLNRTTRKISLTEAGKEYFERCQRIIDDVNELETEVFGLVDKPTGTLRISSPVAFGQIYMLPLLLAFRSQVAEYGVDLSYDDRYSDLVQEGFDVAIRFGELEDSQLIARHVGSSARVCVASPSYLSKHGTPQVPNDLKNHNCITYTHLFSSVWPLRDVNGLLSIKVGGNFRANSGYAIRDAVLNGVGIALVPSLLVKEQIEGGTVVPILNEYAPDPIKISAVYPSNRLIPRKVKLFVDFMKKEFLKIPLLHPLIPLRPVPRLRSKPAVVVEAD
ncbi:MAG: LysR family transcriptional regulator [Proteobacteria bacterium]|nr:LysR family transcriptional regulator [Pseudomonadota bacterium]MDA1331325.1 LysR family transcriptional regulator [Pseudomonadota bacterium]